MAEPQRDLVVVGGSAGSIDSLIRLVGELPPDLPAAMLVVVHMPPDGESHLPAILARAGALDAAAASDGEPLTAARITVAPPDRHLTVTREKVRVTRGPRENRARPAVDPLFRSAAVHHGSRAVGIVLSGALDDGAAGLRTIRDAGGLAVVQDPRDAFVPGMPKSAIAAAEPHHILAADEIGRRLPELLREPAHNRGLAPVHAAALLEETVMAEMDPSEANGERHPEAPSPFGCPDCGGVLWEIDERGAPRFRCRVGHAYSVRALLAAQDAQLEDSLWAGLRALEERESLSRRLAERSYGSGSLRERMERRSREAAKHTATLRRFLEDAIAPVAFDGPVDGGETARADAAPAAAPAGSTSD